MPSYLVDEAVTTSTESQSKQENRGGINIPTQLHAFCSSPGGGGGYYQKNWIGVCGPLPKTRTLFMTKICDFPYPIYDLTFKSIPCFRPAL